MLQAEFSPPQVLSAIQTERVAHAFKAAELCITAQNAAVRLT